MNALRQIQIGTRLSLGFALLIAAILVSAGLSVWRLGAVDAEVKQLLEERMPTVDQAAQLKDNANTEARGVRNIALLSDKATQAKEKMRISDMRSKSSAICMALAQTLKSDKGREALRLVQTTRQALTPALDESMVLAESGRHDEAGTMLLTKVRPLQIAYFKALDDLRDQETSEMTATGQNVRELTHAVVISALVIALIASACGAGLAWSITRSITQPLTQAMNVAQAVAQGDLRTTILDHHTDETGQLLSALQGMNANLLNIVSQVRMRSDSVATGSTQIAIGNNDLSQRTEMQAANLQQTVASMEELASTVQHSAETARTANQLALTASESAHRGGNMVSEVVQTMAGISTSSRKISDIIGVIDGIAFQTNILALNAAVEAARAGEQGRGFAVVASEVRMLASRSAGAAKDIKTLINQSVEQVATGSRMVDDAGKAMTDIVNQVRQVSALISEISASTHEQTQGISQVADAASQLDQVTQQNAALVEESAAAASSLQQQARGLAELVSVFKV